MLKKIIEKITQKNSQKINVRNRAMLTNYDTCIICGNCLGGYIYHWLGLKFNSPFINLFLSNEDFIAALEDWDNFIEAPIVEYVQNEFPYPIGLINGVKLHFMHYSSFDEATEAWERRKKRITSDNMCVMFSNFEGEQSILERFEKLPFQRKVVFVESRTIKSPSAFYIKGYRLYKKMLRILRKEAVPNLFHVQNLLTGKRFIDQFDYVSFINSAK